MMDGVFEPRYFYAQTRVDERLVQGPLAVEVASLGVVENLIRRLFSNGLTLDNPASINLVKEYDMGDSETGLPAGDVVRAYTYQVGPDRFTASLHPRPNEKES